MMVEAVGNPHVSSAVRVTQLTSKISSHEGVPLFQGIMAVVNLLPFPPDKIRVENKGWKEPAKN